MNRSPWSEAERRSLRHFALLKKPATSSVLDATDEDLLRLGVRPIWLETFDELPAVLERIRGAAVEP